MASNIIGEQAVVIGGGMGGLAAAGALANHFEKVVVLERDFLPPNVSERPGTPQCRHIHALLAGGQRALCELFPVRTRSCSRRGGAASCRRRSSLGGSGLRPIPTARSRLARLFDVASAD